MLREAMLTFALNIDVDRSLFYLPSFACAADGIGDYVAYTLYGRAP